MNAFEKFSPMPPQALRERVSGTADESWFDTSGLLTVGEWARALASQGRSFREFETIIDFGCGCGRALRHLKPTLDPEQQLIGLDPDQEAIGWLSNALPDVTVHAIAELPPVDAIRPACADLILSHSVFTHLPEDVQFAWLGELARMLKPGGLLIASIHGPKVVEEYAQSLIRLEMPGEFGTFHRQHGQGPLLPRRWQERVRGCAA